VPDSAQGFYIPRYMIEGDEERGINPMTPDLKHVADLAKCAYVFKDPEDPSKSRVYGAVPGWEVDNIMCKKYFHYKLDAAGYNYFQAESESKLFASLMSAYNLGKPWVGYLYEPSWIAGKLDLVLLEDAPFDPKLFQEGACEIPRQALMNLSSRQFLEKAPDLVEFFKKYRTGLDRISAALAYQEDTKASHANTAIWFLKEYDYLLDEWLTTDQAKKVRDALAQYLPLRFFIKKQL
jgi:glycine betaine/proline transport system permease protein/glycine betaine/proline transport system substrate-binding protein